MDHEIIDNLLDLYVKYQDNVYAREKFLQYLMNSEEYIIQQIREKEERDRRRAMLEKHKEQFIYKFLLQNNYLYIPDSSLFVHYDTYNYSLVCEDIIWGKILTKINNEKHLMPWKQKVRMELLMTIRKKHIQQCTPESNTIQKVLQIISSSVAENKDYAKYFLTIIGDTILKKHTTNVYLTNNKITKFIEFLQYEFNKYIKTNITTIFKTKYHFHNYRDLRIFPLHQNIEAPFLWEHYIKQNVLNIIVVACHYSERYKSADKYIEQKCYSENVRNHVFQLKNETKETFIQTFINSMLETSDTLSISQKEMQYIWKNYLDSQNIQCILFNTELTELLSKQYNVNENGDYLNVTCNKIKYISYFNEYISETLTHISSEYECDEFTYEISELLELFNIWKQSKNYNVTIDEKQFKQLLQHFHEAISIKDERNVCNCLSTMWNKKNDILTFLDQNDESSETPIVELYETYCKYVKDHDISFNLCVSKTYFEKIYKLHTINT